MPARFGALGISVLALVASFGFVYALGRPFATEAEADPPSSPTNSVPSPTATPSEPASPVVIRISVFTGRLDRGSREEPIPGGAVWLLPGKPPVAGGATPTPGNSTTSEDARLCLRLPVDWRPVTRQDEPAWIQEDEPDPGTALFCRSIDSAATGPVQIQVEKPK